MIISPSAPSACGLARIAHGVRRVGVHRADQNRHAARAMLTVASTIGRSSSVIGQELAGGAQDDDARHADLDLPVEEMLPAGTSIADRPR